MRLLAALFLTTGVLLSAFISPAPAKTLTVVADEWPPFSGEALPNKGISLDVIRSVLERAGYQVEVAVVPWARIMDGARKGSYDLIGSLFLTEDLKKHVNYSDAYYTTDVKFLRKVGSGHNFESLDDLHALSIAVGDGFLYSEAFDQADFLNKLVVTTTLQCVQMVAHGRADLTLDSEEVVRYALDHQDENLKSLVEFLPTPLASRGIHMAVRKNLPDGDKLLADFNRTLNEMKQDGSYRKILVQHSIP